MIQLDAHPVFSPFHWNDFLGIVERALRSNARLMLIVDHGMSNAAYIQLEESLSEYLSAINGIDWNQYLIFRSPLDCRPNEIMNLATGLMKGVLLVDSATYHGVTLSNDSRLSQCMPGNRLVLHRNGMCTLYQC